MIAGVVLLKRKNVRHTTILQLYDVAVLPKKLILW